MLHDILIIGAGPCGLALAARLKDHTPSAIFTDEEHQRYHWINKHRGKMTLVRAHKGKIKAVGVPSSPSSSLSASSPPSSASVSGVSSSSSSKSSSYSASSSATSMSDTDNDFPSSPESHTNREKREERDELSMLILDSTSNSWLQRWNSAFRTLEIQQLRSPMFFHIDPGDRDGMLAYTNQHNRTKDLWEISGCVGREMSKHKRKQKQKQKQKKIIGDTEIDERDRKDYFSPSTGLFADFCGDVIRRYGLDGPGLVERGEVVDLQYDFFEAEEDGVGTWSASEGKVFKVVTKDERVFYARAVVLAVGPGGRKIIPAPFEMPLPETEREGACHSSEIRTFPPPNVKRKIQTRRETNLVIVGGGLSSAQIVDMAVRKGVSKVWFLMRSDFKVKHFDITLSWMGKFKNYEKAVFWSADTDAERMEMIKIARNGGSITPRYQKILREHVAAGRVSIHTRTIITSKEYCSISKTWRLTTDPPIPDLPEEIDYIYFATGMHMDVNELPLLQTMHRDYPIETIQGLPCITDDLMWRDDVPLFLTGRLAALRLGPGAANLEGARLGAERIAWGVEEEVLGKLSFEVEGFDEELDRERECFCGLRNRYAGLAEV